MNVGLRLSVVIGFMAICCGTLAIANRPPQGIPVEQILPSPYVIDEDFHIFPPSHDFRLEREAAVTKPYRADVKVPEVKRLLR